MHCRKLILITVLYFFSAGIKAQTGFTYDEVNAKSYSIYEKGSWQELLDYGKEAITEGQDFGLLRLRMGYANFTLNNFSAAIKQYEIVLQKDSHNETAHYYVWLCRKYLNQGELASASIPYLSSDIIKKEKLHPVTITEAGIEGSYKNVGLPNRGNPLYTRIDLHMRFGWNLNMYQAVAFYNQTIAEPALIAVSNNNKININQNEYYNKIWLNINKRLQLKAAYHYLYTPFNNYIYNNHVGLIGLVYNHNYFSVQADAIIGNITDTSQQQYNFTANIYPLGNLNLYAFSTASISRRNNKSRFNFKEVIGVKLTKNIWVEGNATFGSFSNFFENDALYVYNAIDRNLIKAGGTIYFVITPIITAQAGYTFEEREFYKQTKTFYQHSITGGLSCKF